MEWLLLKEAMDALHKANPMISYQDILLQYAAWSRMISEDRLHFPYFRKGVTLNGSALLRYAMIISVQKLTQENTKQNTKKATENELGLTKKDFLISTSEDVWNVIAPD